MSKTQINHHMRNRSVQALITIIIKKNEPHQPCTECQQDNSGWTKPGSLFF